MTTLAPTGAFTSITMRRIGGGAKRLYRIVDFKRNKLDMPATVTRIEYDPNRTAFIALVQYEDGVQNYILAPQRLAVGDKVVASAKADIKPGNAMPFSGMPIGTIIHNIEMKPGKGGQIARAAGTYAQFVGRDGGYAQIRLSSGELRLVRYVLKKAEASKESGRNEVIKIWSRRSTILPQFVGLTFGVYNGKKHIPVNVSEDMIGQKFGEYSPTRTYYGHAADKKAKRK